MKPNQRTLALVLFFILSASVGFLYLKHQQSGIMQDVYLRGILEINEPYSIKWGWYEDHAIKRGDLVLYRYSSNAAPVVKVARAVPGDSFHLVRDTKNHGWNIEINGHLLREFCIQDSTRLTCNPYHFGSPSPPTLSLYEKSHAGVVGKNEVILFSSFSPGFQDSGVFGLINIRDILGKVENQSDPKK